MALWDLLGKHRGEPAWKLLGWERAFSKTAYASQLFGDAPGETLAKALRVRESGFRAAKFGWGPFGLNLADDEAQVRAAREGLGPDVALLVDAGTIWGEDVEEAARRLPVLHECGALAQALITEKIAPDTNGEIQIPDRPGLGMNVCLETIRQYLVPVEIRVGGRLIHQTPEA